MVNIDELIESESLHRTEGERGVRNLCRLCNLIGYKDKTYFGQFENASYGDLILFLEDNADVVEAIIDFMRDNQELYD